MTEKDQTRISKFLSLVLRHQPETINLTLDANGWANTQELLNKMNQNGFNLTFADLKTVVDSSDKKRFILSPDHTNIRANQGHSVSVDLHLPEETPPSILYHGTAERNLPSILEKGLLKGERHHVHLSVETTTALNVGARYGKPVLLKIDAKAMHDQEIKFYRAENNVWLTICVDPKYITIQ